MPSAQEATRVTASTEPGSTAPDNGIDADKLLRLEERLYQPVEVAYILGLQQATVQKYCRDGRIAAIKPGRSWLISATEIKRYLKEGPLTP